MSTQYNPSDPWQVELRRRNGVAMGKVWIGAASERGMTHYKLASGAYGMTGPGQAMPVGAVACVPEDWIGWDDKLLNRKIAA